MTTPVAVDLEASSDSLDPPTIETVPRHDRFAVRAMLLGERLVLRAIEGRIGAHPPVVPIGDDGFCVLFRYGTAVFFNVAREAREAFIKDVLGSRIIDCYDEPEVERVNICIDPQREEDVDERGDIVLHQVELQRIQIVAEVLAKSVVLAEYEERVARAFDITEPLARELESHGRGRRGARELLRYIGSTLRIEQQMVGRVAMGEKPELLWENPQLETLYLRLADEYEINERRVALDRKLQLVTSTTRTMLDVLQTARSLRLEWYIVILIVVEVALMLYELFLKNKP